ncbi:hypothetical protein BV25DRAFT_1991658 [Artomyces pyxidatus]|uniref:Uncharacterized protein n=1 Tax=Artomyces pyxidatus TaxID=48021 RepID=A0ACB8T0W7_9AGAM|nr:hypothetical protein BV25DRAFT_1991658 [Artomyces pyxidatus]
MNSQSKTVSSRAAAKKARAAFSRMLSSSPEPDSDTRPSQSQSKSRSRKRVSRAETASVSSNTVSKRSHGLTPRTSRSSTRVLPSILAPLSSTSSTSTSDSEDERIRSIRGPLVWVRVNNAGQLAPDQGVEDRRDYFWWPGCAVKGSLKEGPVFVKLFGRIDSTAARDVTVASPSPAVILPMKKPGRDTLQFMASTFRSPRPDSGPVSPSKRPRTDLDQAFRSAVDLMLEADARQNDGLPSSLSSYKGPVHHPARSEPAALEKASSASPELWLPPPPDPFVDVPGEPILSLAKKNKTEYWPAKVEEYIPPERPGLQPKYRIQFLDESMANVTRDMFYTADEPGFATCKLGQFESVDSEGEVDSDNDDAGYDELLEPEPKIPPPSASEFCALSIHEQFAYIKPVLRAVLENVYPPAYPRHQAFMQGGLSRYSLQTSATGKGDLTAREVGRLGRILQGWVLGREASPSLTVNEQPDESRGEKPTPLNKLSQGRRSRASSVATDISDVPPPSSAAASFITSSSRSGQGAVSGGSRPTGSNDYEALSRIDRVQYCLLVLLHEATVQLLLWRSGERHSLDPVDAAEEERLHALGSRKADEIDFVSQVRRLRRMKAKDVIPARPPKGPVGAYQIVSPLFGSSPQYNVNTVASAVQVLEGAIYAHRTNHEARYLAF